MVAKDSGRIRAADFEEDGFEKVKREVSVRAGLEALEAKPGHGGRYACPSCENDNPGVITIDDEKQLWYCHRRKHGGSVIDLWMHTFGMDKKGAMKAIAGHFDIRIKSNDKKAGGRRPAEAEASVDESQVALRGKQLFQRCQPVLRELPGETEDERAEKASLAAALKETCFGAAREEIQAIRRDLKRKRVLEEFSEAGGAA